MLNSVKHHKLIDVRFYYLNFILYFCTMFKNMINNELKKAFIIVMGVILFASCSQYEKVLKSPDLEWKYDKAMEYYADEQFTRSATLFEQLIPYTRGAQRSDSINFFHAMSYYKQQDYIMAEHYFKEFTRQFPKNKFAEEAEYLHAYCNYLMSPRPSLDQSNTYAAIEAFQLFMIKYPRSEKVPDALKLIETMRNKLVEKSFMSAKLYFDLEDYKASIVALQNSLNEFPNTKHREEIMFLILKSSYLLAQNSVVEKQKERYQNTLDEYYSFIAEFPNSEYLNEVQAIHESTTDYLGVDPTNPSQMNAEK